MPISIHILVKYTTDMAFLQNIFIDSEHILYHLAYFNQKSRKSVPGGTLWSEFGKETLCKIALLESTQYDGAQHQQHDQLSQRHIQGIEPETAADVNT